MPFTVHELYSTYNAGETNFRSEKVSMYGAFSELAMIDEKRKATQ